MFQQYLLHKGQHVYKSFYNVHIKQHHGTYDRNDITNVLKNNSLYNNLDLYFYGNIICYFVNYFIFSSEVLLFQIFLGTLELYLHNEYHKKNSVLSNYSFFKYLKARHIKHHQCPYKNYFLIDPTFDIIFNTYE